ncbi:N-alpha-acetyltransferase 80 isoform X1 [Halyomorpha halys]|uniref:N-alpha-acetyltransferase 80 isoform X1 n=1 Tax=Halyomorpha halys TaxID=286706 RepID=UPI0006D5163D|nr:N-acetyltransferase 6 isoform X1 [Halyomorpha halys]
MEFLQVYPIHKCKQFIVECCDLINSEWPRSKAARLQSLYMSCDKFPTSLVLILAEQQVVGHVKLTEIKLGGDELMIESMIIHREHRGKGWGKLLMEEAEDYAQRQGKIKIYLSTRGQEGFYSKLGYEICQPVMYFGFCDSTPKSEEEEQQPKKNVITNACPNAPPPPPLPKKKYRLPKKYRKTAKTYMSKTLK